MKSKTLLLFSSLIILFSSCSKEEGKTNALVSLKLSGITNLSSGIGSGGVLLFGKSATSGEQFGRIVATNEDTLELPNGDWTFFALMWESNAAGARFAGNAYCGKSSYKLSGVATNIAMTLTNANCADNDFSNGDIYTDGLGKKRFADFFIEECDDLSKSTNFYCRGENQGSAISYRMIFQSYTRSGNGAPIFANNVMFSQCMKAEGVPSIYTQSMAFNFPSSKSAMPFVASVEMFLGSPDCGMSPANDMKGRHLQVFAQGIGQDSSAMNKLVKTPASVCNVVPTTPALCEDYLGDWTISFCNNPSLSVKAFVPASECGGAGNASTGKQIKQMVSLPKEMMCNRATFMMSGSDVFPGGDGSLFRPYKICNEWQLNQIGEIHPTVEDFTLKSFKLMNNLDMNVTDFNPLLRPVCAGVGGGLLENHHNLNPLSKITVNNCSTLNSGAGREFYGVFNGDGKTIKNGRILADSVANLGFVRTLGVGGVIKNLNFKNLEVRGGGTEVGSIAGSIYNSAKIINVKILGGEVEGDAIVGGITGSSNPSSLIDNVEVRDFRIHADMTVGGLVGNLSGSLKNSMFRGEIKQHMSADGFAGGLVAVASPGSEIRTSFSEGILLTSLKKAAGVVGHNNGSTISDVYSNMYIRSMYQNNNAVVGGIVAVNAGPNITNVYSDSVLEYKGGGSGVVIDGISASGDSFSMSSCATTAATPVSTGCSTSNLANGATVLAGANLWKADVVGTLPRLKWEFDKMQRACLLTANLQVISYQNSVLGRGSLLNPFVVCNDAQLKELDGAPSTAHFRLAQDISIKNWFIASHTIQSFAGHLNGDDYSIYGMTVNASSGGNIGIFANNTGSISKLNIVANKVTHNNTGGTGVLAGVNSGLIKEVELTGNEVVGQMYVGAVVGTNSGTIDKVTVDSGSVKGGSYVGGIAGKNDSTAGGVIKRVSSNVNIQEYGSSSYEYFGGITGYNAAAASVRQAVFSGMIGFSASSTVSGSLVNIGGLVGANEGIIENSMTKNYASIRVRNNEMVGGLVGLNDATGEIRKSFALGSLIYHSPTPGNPVPGASRFGGITGENQGLVDNTFFLENNVGALIEYPTSSAGCSAGSIDFTTPGFASLTASSPGVDLVALMFKGNNGDNLQNFHPFTITTDNYVPYPYGCSGGTQFELVKSYDYYPTGKKSIANFGTLSTFANYDIAYDSKGAGGDIKLGALLEYHMATMDGREPMITPPVWEFEAGDSYPRLLQVND